MSSHRRPRGPKAEPSNESPAAPAADEFESSLRPSIFPTEDSLSNHIASTFNPTVGAANETTAPTSLSPSYFPMTIGASLANAVHDDDGGADDEGALHAGGSDEPPPLESGQSGGGPRASAAARRSRTPEPVAARTPPARSPATRTVARRFNTATTHGTGAESDAQAQQQIVVAVAVKSEHTAPAAAAAAAADDDADDYEGHAPPAFARSASAARRGGIMSLSSTVSASSSRSSAGVISNGNNNADAMRSPTASRTASPARAPHSPAPSGGNSNRNALRRSNTGSTAAKHALPVYAMPRLSQAFDDNQVYGSSPPHDSSLAYDASQTHLGASQTSGGSLGSDGAGGNDAANARRGVKHLTQQQVAIAAAATEAAAAVAAPFAQRRGSGSAASAGRQSPALAAFTAACASMDDAGALGDSWEPRLSQLSHSGGGATASERAAAAEAGWPDYPLRYALARDGSAPQPGPNTLRVLVTTDNHVGHQEGDALRREDSFRSLEEAFRIAIDNFCDCVIIGGDLFDLAKPSQRTLNRVSQTLRDYCFGNEPVSFDVVSDCNETFVDGQLNFRDANFNIQLPVFAIHGNHDPPGPQNTSAIEILHSVRLLNYLGKTADPETISIAPVCLAKGDTRVALYGLGNVRDDRLYNTFERGRVSWRRPVLEARPNDDPAVAAIGERVLFPTLNPDGTVRTMSEASIAASEGEFSPDGRWFNVAVVHQNRNRHAREYNSHLDPEWLPPWMELAVWGHEHESRLTLDPRARAVLFVPNQSNAEDAAQSDSESDSGSDGGRGREAERRRKKKQQRAARRERRAAAAAAATARTQKFDKVYVEDEGPMLILQPGSSVATSLSRSEVAPKHVSILEFDKDSFR